ncbi:adenylylsulfate kinase [Thermostichus sp. MS-CIW-21]|jgi:adenylylsulfate kinase
MDNVSSVSLWAGDDILAKPKEKGSTPMGRRGVTVWFTGLSGAGKTTLSCGVAQQLQALGLPVEVLDGDLVRQHLSKELGFSRADRDENVRRIGFVAEMLTRHGVIVLVSAISPYRATRQEVRQQIGNFIEVFVDAPLEVCEQRDVKGLYRKARAGLIRHFTGIDDPYEPPEYPEVVCKTAEQSISECIDLVMQSLRSHGYLQ